jgi:hypothetical protein
MNEATMSSPQEKFIETLYKYALEYLERGWSFIPVSLSSKKPLNEWMEYQTRRPTREEVDDWFTNGAPTKSGDRVKYFNLSVITGSISGIVILDCDNEAAIKYAEANRMCSPFCVRTTRGMHFYFKHPMNGARYGNKVGGMSTQWPVIPGLDFRGDGGYAILPPSVSFNTEGEAKHQYEWEDCPYDFDQMPVWTASQPTVMDVTNIPAEEFRFDKLSLADTRIASPENVMSVWEQMEAHVKVHGTLGEGQGRNAWLIRYAGEQVRKGVVGQDLFTTCEAFEQRFFATHLDRTEFTRTVKSALDMDRRNYPQDYDANGDRIDHQEEQLKKSVSSVFVYDDLANLSAYIRERKTFADPVIIPNTITQIVGYNGHGKSIFAYGLCWSLAVGIDYGPITVSGPQRVMYFDFETPLRTFEDRVHGFGKMFGHPHDNLIIWNSNLADAKGHPLINLMEQDGIAIMKNLLDTYQPNVVVFDTVRSAFHQMDEKSPEAWGYVNQIMKAIRNAGAAVVLIHHRNKPGESGLGREAGSTAQLTDIDTQVFLTSVYRKEDDAKKKAAIHDSAASVEDASGRSWTPFGYLESKIDPMYWRISHVFKIDYGKVRQWTDNHADNFVGLAEHLHTGESKIVSTLSPMQKARALHSTGISPRDISSKLFVPYSTVNEWLTRT